MRILAITAASIVLASPAFATEYVSPDGLTTATIATQSKNDCEATISFHRQAAEDVRVSYVSDDHEHGACVDHASWTPDSKFFVYSLVSSGGHQPWHTPIMFYSREKSRVVALENYLPDPITRSDFTVHAPDQLKFETTAIPIGSKPPQHHSVALSSLRIPAK